MTDINTDKTPICIIFLRSIQLKVCFYLNYKFMQFVIYNDNNKLLITTAFLRNLSKGF